jgi:hypothetical protein
MDMYMIFIKFRPVALLISPFSYSVISNFGKLINIIFIIAHWRLLIIRNNCKYQIQCQTYFQNYDVKLYMCQNVCDWTENPVWVWPWTAPVYQCILSSNHTTIKDL